MNAHYNGWFNANELIKEAVINLSNQHRDNYNKLLDVYTYVNVENPKSVAQPMDKAIEKVAVVVAMHRISNWTDDCYLAMGKAQFLKHDYEGAQETLEYFVDQFDPDRAKRIRRKSKMTPKERKAYNKAKEKERTEAKKNKEKERKAKLKELKKRQKEREKERAKIAKERKAAQKAKKKGKPVPKKNPVESPVVSQQEVGQTPTKTDSTDTANKPKPPVKPKRQSYFLKHKPCFDEGLLWLARTYTARQEFDKARKLLTRLEEYPNISPKVRKAIDPARADFYIAQKEYAKAIPHLERAIKTHSRRQNRVRLVYVLAQLYQKQGQSEKAYLYFARVLKEKPTYEMEFNARLSLNLFAYKTGKGTADDAIRQLEKMSRDRKNQEYLDQIYYAMAQIYLDRCMKPEAIAALRQSLNHSNDKSAQKVESYYLLAQLYLEAEQFVEAYTYLDSTKAAMAEFDERKLEVTKLAHDYKDIAKHISAIAKQDSLISIAGMTPNQQRELAEKLYAEKKKSLVATTTSPALPTNPRDFDNMPGIVGMPGVVVSNFFAYNPSSLQRGKRDFERKWGNRPLEDNWRRANRQGSSISERDVAIDNDASDGISQEDIDMLLADVPRTPEALRAAQDSIASAMYQLGMLFYDRLQKYHQSLKYLDLLESRFPAHKNELPAWYYQCLDYKALNQFSQADVYRQKIIQKYPDTQIGRSLSDPNFLEKYRKDQRKLEQYYEDAYAAFQQGQGTKALDMIRTAPGLFKSLGDFAGRFALLQALCIGQTEGLDPYKAALRDVIGKFGDKPEGKRAREMLRILEGDTATKPGAGTASAAPDGAKPVNPMVGSYVHEPDKMHFVMVLLKSSSIVEEAKLGLANFNREFYKLDDLKVTNIALSTDGQSQLLIVRRFKNANSAAEYMKTAQLNASKFIDSKKAPHELMAISQDNYRTLLSTRNIDDYRTFFDEHFQ